MGQKDVTLKTCNNCGVGAADMAATRCPICSCAYILQTADLYESEVVGLTAYGRCSGHPMLPDGSHIRTSTVKKETDEFILTRNTLYMKRLGAYNPSLRDPLPHFNDCENADDDCGTCEGCAYHPDNSYEFAEPAELQPADLHEVTITDIDQLTEGSILKCVFDGSSFYTRDNTYKVLNIDINNELAIEDDKPESGPHFWYLNEGVFQRNFVLIQVPEPSADPEVDAASGD